MDAAGPWIATSDQAPPENRYVLVWDQRRGLAMMAKWHRGRWFSCANNIRRKDGTHWAEVIGPDGTHSSNPRLQRGVTRESQDN